MSGKHTPGPWVSAVSEKHNRAVNIYAGTPFRDPPKEVIAWALPLSPGRLSERDANALLIASAPELLEALKEIIPAQDDADTCAAARESELARRDAYDATSRERFQECDPKILEYFRAAKLRLMNARKAVYSAIANAEGRFGTQLPMHGKPNYDSNADAQWRAKYQQAMETWAEETCQLHAKNDELLNALKAIVEIPLEAPTSQMVQALSSARAVIAKSEGTNI